MMHRQKKLNATRKKLLLIHVVKLAAILVFAVHGSSMVVVANATQGIRHNEESCA
jgi:hypothetical protein